MDILSLLPYPRTLTAAEGQYILTPHRRIVLEGAAPQALHSAGRRLQAALAEYAQVDWELAASSLGPADEIGAVLRIAPLEGMHEQGYTLAITPIGINIQARTPAGIFYGVCTLVQILQQQGRVLPALHIADWPDFPVRGLMLDISRDKVPRLETLLALIDMVAGWKLNQIQLYMEHTFAYRQHPDVWAAASPLTGDEILMLDAFCRERHIELVPNQNSFGHMARWLTHARYAALAETQVAYTTPGGQVRQGPWSLCPLDPGSIALMGSLYDELLPYFSSTQFNVGCDEPFDLGQGCSAQECAQRGTERVYLDYLLKIHKEVTARRHTMQFWGDIIVQAPELIPELPKDSVALEWGYEANHPFDAHGEHFAAAGIPFYTCPGTSSWCSLAGRTDNALGNLRNAAETGLKHGAVGYLNTDWGDMGHWQVLPVSFLGFAAGAAYSWALDANRSRDMSITVSIHAFHDPTGCMGQVAADLGNIYKLPGLTQHNSSALFWILQLPFDTPRPSGWQPPDYATVLAAIDQAMAPLAQARMQQADAALIVAEYENTARLMRHACRRGLLQAGAAAGTGVTAQALDDDMRDIIHEYKRIWLLRNRPGGLADSVARFEKARADYLPG